MAPTAVAAPRTGVHDIPEADYFAAVRALSASGIKLLLPPSCPAKFRWAQDHRVHKDVFDVGSAAHKVVLGSGPEIEVIDADSWRTNAAKDARDYARMAGKIPVLTADYERVCRMADMIRAHPLARALFNPDHGRPEMSLFWTDPETGVPCRARPDWLPDPRGGRLTIPDYKSCQDAGTEAVMRAVGNFGYHIQHAHYAAGAAECGLDDDPAFVFVFQEKDPPYLVNVVQLDAAAIQSGRIACRAGAEIFRDCAAADLWPGFPMDIPEIPLPPWKTRIPEEYYSS
jgi:hypothetical protein